MRAALITGAASGIGEALAKSLAPQHALTLVDIDGPGAERVAREIQAAGGSAIAVRADICDRRQQAEAFAAHMQSWGRLDAAILNAGIGERGRLLADEGEGWKATLDLDFVAVVEGLRLAVRAMTGGRRDARCPEGCAIMVTASAGGVFPMPEAPIYAAAKAACVQLVRSLAPTLQKRHGISLTALCPQFADTALVRGMQRQDAATAARVMHETKGRLLTAEQVAAAGVALLSDPSRSGQALVVLVNGSWWAAGPSRLQRLEQPAGGGSSALGAAAMKPDPALLAWAAAAVPSSTRLVEVHTLSTDFPAATRIATRMLPSPLPAGTVLIRRAYAAVNASDVNYSSGRYHASKAEAAAALPYPAGFESVGVVAAAAPDVPASLLVPGQPVAEMSFGGFAEWAVAKARHVFPVPACSPEAMVLLTSGLTASIALERCGRLKPGEAVLVTAAAGGTGHIAVQLAKLAGCRVLATCGGPGKAALLRSLGADVVINYKSENLRQALKQAAPNGVDVVYESVGGDTFETCVNALAIKGRLIVIGAMSQYGGGWAPSTNRGLPEKLLAKSATVQGFFLNHYAPDWRRHLAKLAGLWRSGRLRLLLDPHSASFVGLGAVPDAVEWLQSGRSSGKVYVRVASEAPAAAGSRL